MAKIVAVRFTPASLRQMISVNTNFVNDQYYWSTITHFVYHGLYYDYSGFIGTEPNDVTVLNHPLTYTPWIKELKRLWSHLVIVWALPPLPDDILVDMHWAFTGIESLIKNHGIDVIEFNFGNIQSPTLDLDLNTLADEFKEIPCEFWAVLPPPALRLDINVIKNYINLFVINSFGFFGDIRLENDFSNSKLAFTMAVNHYGINPSKVLIGIDTVGVIRNSHTTRLISIPEIEMKKQTMVLHRNYGAGASYLENPKERIYYDDEYVLHQKLLLQHTHGYRGIVLGDLIDDLPRHSIGAIWTMIANYTFMQRSMDTPS